MSPDRPTGFRLSPLQRRAWQLQEHGAGLRVEALLGARTPLDGAAVEAAFGALARDHEILRTHVAEVSGAAVQCVSAPGLRPVDAIALSDAGPSDLWSRVRSIVEARTAAGGSGSLSYVAVVSTETDGDYLYVSLSPLVGDRRSLWLIARAIVDGSSIPPGAGRPLQYADIAEWKHALLESDAAAHGRTFWASQRADASAWQSLPCVRTSAAREPFEPGRAPGTGVRLPSASGGIDRSTLEATALACWAWLGAQYLDTDTVVCGVVSDGRAEAETQAALGPMTAALPVLVRIDPLETVERLRTRLAREVAAARAWQDLFAWELVARRAPQGAGPPFCPLAFEYANEGEDICRDEAGGAPWRTCEVRADVEPYDFKLVCVERDDMLSTHVDYDRAAAGEGDASRLVDLFDRLLSDAIRRPDLPVSALGAAAAPLALRSHEALNDAAAGGIDSPRLVDMFERQVDATPDAIAVVERDACVTFAELNRQANRAARVLREAGVDAETRVGVLVPRSTWMIVSVVAVMKAGGAFVPLEGSPRERLRAIVANCGIRVVLAETEIELFAALGVNVLTESSCRRRMERLPASNLPATTAGANLAYVLFTSGSTGTPKGVMVTHEGVVNYLAWARRAYERTATAGSILFSPLDFDFTITALFVPLVAGRTVLIGTGPAIETLAGSLVDWPRLTFVKLTPAHLRALRHLAPAPAGDAGLLVVGGEALTSDDLEWLATAGATMVVNEYGPTEAVVGCCAYRAPVAELSHARTPSVPIGRPIQHARMYLLQPDGALALPGATGEISIAGTGLARGYIGRPDLTAASFQPDAYAREPGSRAYRTGDLARLLPDGNLVFVGRNDGQVKLRGFRIELEEVEHVARRLPEVRDAAALLAGDSQADARLALAIVTDAPDRFDRERIRAFLAERMPPAAVPGIVARVDAIPMTAHGKVDRRALARDVTLHASSGAGARRPATQAEEDFVEIWMQVLKLQTVGTDDNFFAAGGDSIRSIQVLGLAKARGYDLSLSDVLEAPTILQLAARAGRTRVAHPPEPLPPFAMLAAGDRGRMPPRFEDAYPLASMQHGMLFHSEWDEGVATYHDVVGVHLAAPYDRQVLESCLRDVVGAHSILRTVFDLHTFGEPLQLVLPHADFTLEEHDLRGLDRERQESAIQEWLAHEKERRFDWSRTPPLRFCVQRRGQASFQFNIGFHHALLDGWSTATLLLELLRRYCIGLGTAAGPPPEAPRSRFRDFVDLERTARQSEAARRFWSEYLTDAERTQYGRPSQQPAHAAAPAGVRRHEHVVPPAIHRGLTALSRGLGVPLKSVLLAAHVKALGALVNRQEIVTGVVSNGRLDDIDGDRALGLFLNTLPLRVAVTDRPWRHLIRDVYDCEARWTPHRRLPVADILQNAGTTELFDTAFNFVHYHVYETLQQLPGVRVLQTYAFEETSFALLANFVQSGASERLTLLVDVDAARVPVDPASIADLYENALREVALRPERSAAACAVLSWRDDDLLRAWTSGLPVALAAASAPHQVLARARQVPDRTALVGGEVHLSYKTLIREATQVARWLVRHGVGPERVVALDVDRGIDLLVVCLGTLLARGAYIYVDRTLPEERRRWILDDSRPHLIVTDRERAGAAALEAGRHQWPVRELVAESRRARPDLALQRADLDSACYLVYTSGSTGTPKGIVMPHRPVAALIAWQVEGSIERAPRTLQYTSLSFDVSFQEIYSTWAAGGTLVLIAPDDRARPARMYDLLLRERVERLFLPCAALRQLAIVHEQRGDSERLALIDVITAGDVLNLTPDLRAFCADHPRLGLTNQYGPAETHVATSGTLEGPGDGWPALPGIGTPVAAAAVHLLDDRLRPVPVGSVGEVHIGGEALARGYLGRPDLTAERFVPDVRSGAGARLYRTGDLARFHDGGRLEFLGRNDHQVKVLGHRVELGEIEAVIERVPGIAEAVVAHRVGPDGERQLVACIASGLDRDAAIERVRAALTRALPPYMIPARFAVLSALPRTVSGKIDRRRLPALDGADAPSRPPVEPADATEAAILDIWTRALKRDDIGVEDDFFEAGGHSLTATRIVLSLRERFRVELPIKAVFEMRTIRGMAREIRTRAPARERLARVPRDGPLVLAPQQENWWLNEHLTGNVNPNNICFALRFSGPLHPPAVEQALATLGRRHEALRTAFVATENGGVPSIRPADDGRPALAIVDMANAAPEAQANALSEISRLERGRPFDLAQGALCRATVISLGRADHVVLFTTHHLVCDGWSVDVLTRELSTCYARALDGIPAVLPELEFQYVDFAQWQRDWLSGPGAARQLAYWRRQLAAPRPDLLPPSPLEAEAADVCLAVRGRLPFEMPAHVAGAARAIARRERSTLFSAVLSALELVLASCGDQSDVRVGTFASNRALPGAEHVVGLFTNVVCLRTRLDRSRTFGDLVRAVHTTIADAMAHQDLPFEVLARALEDDDAGARARLFQVLVVWHEASPEPLRLPGVSVTLYRPEHDELPVQLARNALDLKVELVESPATVSGSVAFKLTRFTAADAAGFVEATSDCLMLAERDPAITVAALRHVLEQRSAASSS